MHAYRGRHDDRPRLGSRPSVAPARGFRCLGFCICYCYFSLASSSSPHISKQRMALLFLVSGPDFLHWTYRSGTCFFPPISETACVGSSGGGLFVLAAALFSVVTVPKPTHHA